MDLGAIGCATDRDGPGRTPRGARRTASWRGRDALGAALLAFAMLTGACGNGAGGNGAGIGTPAASDRERPQPSPGRLPTAAAGSITPAPSGAASETPNPGLASPEPGRSPSATFQPLPPQHVSLALGPDPAAWFAHQQRKTWCAPAAVQTALAALGLADTSPAFQASLEARIGTWTSRADSRNGGWGPLAMARALAEIGAPGYEVRTFPTREAALLDAARAIQATSSPVILLAWRGAHAWVMTGFQASADPARFPDAAIEGAFILDPWYPWISTIWGPSDPPGTFQDTAEMERNFLPWKRPEGRYPDRDGRFVIVAPTDLVADDG